MKVLSAIVFLSLTLSSCANLPKQDKGQSLIPKFVMNTACDQKTSVKTIGEFYNFLGQYNGGSYLFTCGEERYACRVWYIDASFSYQSTCSLKLAK